MFYCQIFVVGILFVAKEDVVLILDIFVEYSPYGGALHKEIHNQSSQGFQIDIIYGPSTIHLNIKLAMSYMKNEKQHQSTHIEKNNAIHKSH
jgi:hypothetical protein